MICNVFLFFFLKAHYLRSVILCDISIRLPRYTVRADDIHSPDVVCVVELKNANVTNVGVFIDLLW